MSNGNRVYVLLDGEQKSLPQENWHAAKQRYKDRIKIDAEKTMSMTTVNGETEDSALLDAAKGVGLAAAQTGVGVMQMLPGMQPTSGTVIRGGEWEPFQASDLIYGRRIKPGTGEKFEQVEGPGLAGKHLQDWISGQREKLGTPGTAAAGLTDVLSVLGPAAASGAQKLGAMGRVKIRGQAQSQASQKAPDVALRQAEAERKAAVEALKQKLAASKGREASVKAIGTAEADKAKAAADVSNKRIGKKIKSEIEPLIKKGKVAKPKDSLIVDPKGAPVKLPRAKGQKGKRAAAIKAEADKQKLLEETFKNKDTARVVKEAAKTRAEASARAEAAVRGGIHDELGNLAGKPIKPTAAQIAKAENDLMAQFVREGIKPEAAHGWFSAMRDNALFLAGRATTGSHIGGTTAKMLGRKALKGAPAGNVPVAGIHSAPGHKPSGMPLPGRSITTPQSQHAKTAATMLLEKFLRGEGEQK